MVARYQLTGSLLRRRWESMGFEAEETIRADADRFQELSYGQTKKRSVFSNPSDSEQQTATFQIYERFKNQEKLFWDLPAEAIKTNHLFRLR